MLLSCVPDFQEMSLGSAKFLAPIWEASRTPDFFTKEPCYAFRLNLTSRFLFVTGSIGEHLTTTPREHCGTGKTSLAIPPANDFIAKVSGKIFEAMVENDFYPY